MAARPPYIKDKQEVAKDVSGNVALSNMARSLRELKDQKEAQESALKETNKAIDEISINLAEAMEDQRVDSFKVTGVGSIRIDIKNRPSITDLTTFVAWLDMTRQGDLAPRTVHHARLTSLVTEILQRGDELPPAVSNYEQKRAVIRRS